MVKKTPVVVSARGLRAAYGSVDIWHGADFKVAMGEFVGVLGPNGAGKTTLFRLLLGLMRPAAGQLEVLGRQPRRGDSRIGYVPQRHSIDKETRLESLELVKLGVNGANWGPSFSSSQVTASALAALKAVDAENLAHQSLGFLSGGELQRIFIAQALVSRPDLLLLDEPLANLDIRRQTALVNLIAGIAKTQAVAVMLIAHDINPLIPVMDKVIYMANGQVATGNIEEVVNSKALSRLYDAPVEVLKDSRGRLAVLGTEEAAHPHD